MLNGRHQRLRELLHQRRRLSPFYRQYLEPTLLQLNLVKRPRRQQARLDPSRGGQVAGKRHILSAQKRQQRRRKIAFHRRHIGQALHGTAQVKQLPPRDAAGTDQQRVAHHIGHTHAALAGQRVLGGHDGVDRCNGGVQHLQAFLGCHAVLQRQIDLATGHQR
ncbi:hypothetical protein D3C71_1751370 [compost metagenome]